MLHQQVAGDGGDAITLGIRPAAALCLIHRPAARTSEGEGPLPVVVRDLHEVGLVMVPLVSIVHSAEQKEQVCSLGLRLKNGAIWSAFGRLCRSSWANETQARRMHPPLTHRAVSRPDASTSRADQRSFGADRSGDARPSKCLDKPGRHEHHAHARPTRILGHSGKPWKVLTNATPCHGIRSNDHRRRRCIGIR